MIFIEKLDSKFMSQFLTLTLNMGVPKGWNNFSKVGEVIEGTKFIAFKVPLSGNATWNLSTLKRNVPDLTDIIDLTDTEKYYRAADCEALGWTHTKIRATGGGQVPSQTVVESFYSAVAGAQEDGLIGVHCTHGLNRTGYLICRYLIEKEDWDPETAIDAFNQARGHQLERENYLAHLRARGWEPHA